ncbi:DegV family protein [Algiphilus sp. W345]|uniref:DegV family protein n=1 Tax=Banduia mediterranea TaxID=3075609 RepID=A0ABU2WE44_9GAMM|nr:DegV family protein [Algiphilus sp. W345]MDT0495775.1 DegV family protein [Algiphilus sp. W345]
MADASCDLPQEFIRQHGIRILPISIRLGNEMLSYSAEQIRAVFLERSASRSPVIMYLLHPEPLDRRPLKSDQ